MHVFNAHFLHSQVPSVFFENSIFTRSIFTRLESRISQKSMRHISSNQAQGPHGGLKPWLDAEFYKDGAVQFQDFRPQKKRRLHHSGITSSEISSYKLGINGSML